MFIIYTAASQPGPPIIRHLNWRKCEEITRVLSLCNSHHHMSMRRQSRQSRAQGSARQQPELGTSCLPSFPPPQCSTYTGDNLSAPLPSCKRAIIQSSGRVLVHDFRKPHLCFRLSVIPLPINSIAGPFKFPMSGACNHFRQGPVLQREDCG